MVSDDTRDSSPAPMKRRQWLLGSAAALGSTLSPACSKPPKSPQSLVCTTTPNTTAANWGRSFAAEFRADAHCHSFNALDLPIDGFLRSLAHGEGVPGFADRTVRRATTPLHAKLVEAACAAESGTSQPVATALISAVSHVLKTKGVELGADGVARLSRVAASSRRSVLAELAKSFPEVSLFMPALVDYAFWEQRGRRRPVYPTATTLPDQVAIHGALYAEANRGQLDAQTGRANAFSVHGYVPFNPLRQIADLAEGQPAEAQAIGIVKQAVGVTAPGKGFAGVKLYPASGFLPLGNARLDEFGGRLGTALDDALLTLYGLCESEDIPIMAHAAESNGFGPDYAWRGAPWAWREVLSRFPKLRLNLGHYGHMRGLDRTCVLSCLAWAEMIAAELMVPDYPNVYADLSYSVLIEATSTTKDPTGLEARQTEYVTKLKDIFARHPDAKSRLLHGTDWWMTERDTTVSAVGGSSNFFTQTQQVLAPLLGSEFAGFGGSNALRFIGVLDAAGQPAVDTGSRKRLLEYYKALGCPKNSLPTWLQATPEELQSWDA